MREAEGYSGPERQIGQGSSLDDLDTEAVHRISGLRCLLSPCELNGNGEGSDIKAVPIAVLKTGEEPNLLLLIRGLTADREHGGLSEVVGDCRLRGDGARVNRITLRSPLGA